MQKDTGTKERATLFDMNIANILNEVIAHVIKLSRSIYFCHPRYQVPRCPLSW